MVAALVGGCDSANVYPRSVGDAAPSHNGDIGSGNALTTDLSVIHRRTTTQP